MCCKVEVGGVDDRCGGELDPMGEWRAIRADGRVVGDVSDGGVTGGLGGVLGGDLVGRVAGVGLTRAEDADGSRDSFDVNEQRFSAAGWDAGSGRRWEVGEASLGNVATAAMIAG